MSADPSMEAIIVVARWQALPGRVDEVLALVTALQQQSRAEPGCLGYYVFRSVEDPAELVLLERYRDKAALEAHRATDHFKDLVLCRIVPMLAARQVELLRAVEAVG